MPKGFTIASLFYTLPVSHFYGTARSFGHNEAVAHRQPIKRRLDGLTRRAFSGTLPRRVTVQVQLLPRQVPQKPQNNFRTSLENRLSATSVAAFALGFYPVDVRGKLSKYCMIVLGRERCVLKVGELFIATCCKL